MSQVEVFARSVNEDGSRGEAELTLYQTDGNGIVRGFGQSRHGIPDQRRDAGAGGGRRRAPTPAEWRTLWASLTFEVPRLEKRTLTGLPHRARAKVSQHPSDRRAAMDKFTKLTGVAAPLPQINVDTDMIIPKQFLKTIKRSGLGKNLFDEMRYDDDGNEIRGFRAEPARLSRGADPRGRRKTSAADRRGNTRRGRFWISASAAWSPPSFADNLFQQLLQERHPAHRPAAGRRGQADGRRQTRPANAVITVDLESQTITGPDGGVRSYVRCRPLPQALPAQKRSRRYRPYARKGRPRSTRSKPRPRRLAPWVSNPLPPVGEAH